MCIQINNKNLRAAHIYSGINLLCVYISLNAYTSSNISVLLSASIRNPGQEIPRDHEIYTGYKRRKRTGI